MKITYDDFKDMESRFINYVEKNNRDPEKIYIGDSPEFVRTADLKQLIHIHDNEFPVDVTTSGKITSKPAPAPQESFLSKLKDKYGDFDTVCGYYDKVIRASQNSYDYYYNSKYDFATLQKMILGGGANLNCTDWCKLSSLVYKELGYPFRLYNVVCKSGGGHVRAAVQDKNANNQDWLSTDPAAISDKNDRYYECLWDNWCDTDNGATIVDVSETNKIFGWMGQ